MTSIFGLDTKIRVVASKTKDYPKFALYQIYKIERGKCIPIYQTTLDKSELKGYEVI